MNARKNDDLRIEEMYEVIQETRRRLNELRIPKDAFINPTTASARNTADGIHSCVYRVAEEAANLEYSTMAQFPEIPWDAVRGMRNRLAHDYRGVDFAYVWDVVHADFDEFERICIAYSVKRGLQLGERVELE